MEFLATIGLASKELFDYNRESFQFDAEQRMTRELMRLDMQVRRFELFREDIRDLVELTVGKMKLYHLVGALFLETTFRLYMEGRIKQQMPPYLVACYYLSVTGAFGFLLLSVYLSIFASVIAHSFAVRLLTRYVRLPIPGMHMFARLNAHLSDYEAQDKRQMLRVPIIDRQQEGWKQREHLGPAEANNAERVAPVYQAEEDLLGGGDLPFGSTMTFMKSTSHVPGKHIQLYRQLQLQWQSYDAYARVCMSLGTNQTLLAFTFFSIGVSAIQFEELSACYASIVFLQFTALHLCYIDIRQLGQKTMWLIQAIPLVAALIAAVEANVADKIPGSATPTGTSEFSFAPAIFVLLAIWFEILLHVAWPSSDDAALPRRFRAVLFLDVFGSLEFDVESMEGQVQIPLFGRPGKEPSEEALAGVKFAQETDEALYNAHASLRRWEAAPAGIPESRRTELAALRRQLDRWRMALVQEVQLRAHERGIEDPGALVDLDSRAWNELSEEEQGMDPNSGSLVGPLVEASGNDSNSYFFDAESHRFVYRVPEGTPVLTFQDLAAIVRLASEQAQTLLCGSGVSPVSQTSVPPTVLGRSAEDVVDAEQVDVSFVDPGTATVGLPSRTLRAGFSLRSQAQASITKIVSPIRPPRLPWILLRMMVRALQIAWLLSGLISTFERVGVLEFDCQSYLEVKEEQQMLQGSDCRAQVLTFTALPAAHNDSDFFRPLTLSCLASEGDGPTQLLVGTARELYLVSVTSTSASTEEATLSFEPLPSEGFPPGTVAFCTGGRDSASGGDAGAESLAASSASSTTPLAAALAAATSKPSSAAPSPSASAPAPASASPSCLLGALVRNGTGVALWRAGAKSEAAVILRIAARDAWRTLAGVLAPCSDVGEQLDLNLGKDRSEGAQCLVLAGWDGQHAPLVAVLLPENLADLSGLGPIQPAFDVTLAPHPVESALDRTQLALQVEESRLRLWASLSSAAFRVLDVVTSNKSASQVNSRSWLRLWWPQFDTPDLQVRAMCRASDEYLYVMGLDPSGGVRWYRARLPAV